MALVDGEGKTLWGVEPTLLGECSSPFDLYAHAAAISVASRLTGGRPDKPYASEVQRRETRINLRSNNVRWVNSEQIFIYPSLPLVILDREPEDNDTRALGEPAELRIRVARSRPFDLTVVTGAFGLAFRASNGENPATTQFYDLMEKSEILQSTRNALARLARPLPDKPPKPLPMPWLI